MAIIFKFFGSIFVNWINSFNNDKGGFSARKEAAFGGFILSAWATFKFTTPENLIEVVTIWLLYSLLCLGIITLQQVTELKSGKKEQPPSQNLTP